MQHLPVYISALLIVSTLLTLFFLYRATRRSKTAMIISICWLALQALISLPGFYTQTSTVPPRFALLIVPPLVFILALCISNRGRNFMRNMDTEWSTLLHIIRIPVEIVLLSLFLYQQVPQLMTFEGRNLDILSGLSAPFIYWGYRRGIIKHKALIVWNIVCLLLLVNIVVYAILSAPFPFQQLAFDQPNVALLYFPFTWLPCFIVPVVLFCHVVVLFKASTSPRSH